MTTAAIAWQCKPPLWTTRATIATDWAAEAGFTSVTDLGCGTGVASLLAPNIAYVGADVVAHTPATRVVDLNCRPIPLFWTREAFILGVIPYLDDPFATLLDLRQFERVIVSYNHWSLKETLFPGGRSWRNRMTTGAFRRLIRDAGFRIVRDRQIAWSERLFLIERIAR